MKKFMSILLTLSLISGISTVTFAAANDTTGTTQTTTTTKDVTLTPVQKEARDAYLKIHSEAMNQLVALRQQTEVARDTNNATATQIKDKLKAKTALNSDSVTKLKDLASQKKTLVEQAKQLHQQKLSLKTQYSDSVKSKDVAKMKTIQQQKLDLNKQIIDLKAKNDAIEVQISPLKGQLKSTREANSGLKKDVKAQLLKAKSIHETIKTEQQEKAKLWVTYKENIKNKDYTTAAVTFKSIIDKKSTILSNIKERGTILNQVLASLN